MVSSRRRSGSDSTMCPPCVRDNSADARVTRDTAPGLMDVALEVVELKIPRDQLHRHQSLPRPVEVHAPRDGRAGGDDLAFVAQRGDEAELWFAHAIPAIDFDRAVFVL